jgi:hypothetical protein
MRPNMILQTIVDLYEIKRPIYLVGPPGGGKTSVVKQAAEKLGARYIHQHAPNMLVEDFGVPDVVHGAVTFGYVMPHWWPTDPEERVVLCFDDRGQCGADIQKVIANIVEERELHGQYLPDNVMVISTGNRAQDKSGANRVLTHLADRETEIEFDTALDDWTSWAINEDVAPSLIAFIRFRPNLLHDFDPQRPKNPTPRSWVKGVSAIVDKVAAEVEFECFKGAVGEGPAGEYTAFRKIEKNLPNIDALLLNPDAGDVPTDPATLYALSGGLAARATPHNFSRVVTYLNRLPPEFGALAVSYAIRKDITLTTSRAFIDWSVQNQDVLL